MDIITELKSTNIPEIYSPSYAAFLPLLEKNRTEIEKIKGDTFQYGLTSRHKLDVYNPPEKSETLPPILLFTYGGGLEVGDRITPNSQGLVYANLGAYFAKNGFLTVIADYRLASAGAVYPDCSKDVGDALDWIVSNLGKRGDTSRIFFLGHSAGALNQSLLLLHPTLLRPDLRERIKGVVFNGGAFRFESKAALVRVQSYYGYDGLHITNSPYGLLRSASDSFVAQLPPILSMRAEKEPKLVADMVEDFNTLMKTRKVRLTEYLIKDHNHISATLALFSGEGEEWGEVVVRWFRERE